MDIEYYRAWIRATALRLSRRGLPESEAQSAALRLLGMRSDRLELRATLPTKSRRIDILAGFGMGDPPAVGGPPSKLRWKVSGGRPGQSQAGR